jgi:hypothetical protein
MNISTKLQRIAELAREHPSRAFTNLAHHIDLDFLRDAFRLTRKNGAPGVDGVTGEEYEKNLEVNLQSLLDRFKSGTYRAPDVRRVHIPKGNQLVRTQLFARQQLVKTRSSFCTFVRSQVKSVGQILPAVDTRIFALKMRTLLPKKLTSVLEPVLRTIQHLSDEIDSLNAEVKTGSAKDFPETAVLQQVHGIGPLISLAFVATVGAPDRFKDSRSLGPYLGLVPRLDQSGRSNPALSITKHGDTYMRSLLVSAATRILGPFGADSDLRRFGLRIIEQGGQRARGKARIAVARKLAVLLHRLLLTGEVYEPLRSTDQPIEEPIGA